MLLSSTLKHEIKVCVDSSFPRTDFKTGVIQVFFAERTEISHQVETCLCCMCCKEISKIFMFA